MYAWISSDKLRVLEWLHVELERLPCEWMAVGGLAGNLWGSNWPLHDLDIDVPTHMLPSLAARWNQHLIRQGRYVDEEFDIELLRLHVQGVEIDISGADDAWCFTPDGVHSMPNRLAQRVLRPLGELAIPCQRLEDLIAYKRVIGRRADLHELAKHVD